MQVCQKKNEREKGQSHNRFSRVSEGRLDDFVRGSSRMRRMRSCSRALGMATKQKIGNNYEQLR
jgi:hypothetical protein